MPKKREFIICAAIKLEDGRIFYGHRHNHCIDAANGVLSWKLNREQISKVLMEQGFVTSTGRFVDRKMAFTIAKNAKQIKGEAHTFGKKFGILYSEDIY